MIQFFIVAIYDFVNNEDIMFSNDVGSATNVVILDDGWSPNITKYVRDGEKTWSDVVEELECMTNVATRDEALALIEKLNALVHRVARDIEEKQQYTVTFRVRSQFSTAPVSAFTYVLSPPDDGDVITLSTDIQTAPPGQIKFKLRFKRTGAWITSFNDTTVSGSLTAPFSPPSGFWKLQTTLPTNITIPTPISLAFSYTANGIRDVYVEQLFMCVDVVDVYLVKNFVYVTVVNYPSWRLAYLNTGYLFLSDTDPYNYVTAPQTQVDLDKGTYAVFVSWRSVQSNVSHRLKIRLDNKIETRNVLLYALDTSPHYQYFGTITTTTPAKKVYLYATIGHSTGFEIEKILFVKLKSTSTIINLSDWIFVKNATVTIENNVLSPIKNVVQRWTAYSNQLQDILTTYDSVDIVADSSSFTTVAIGNSFNVFSLRTDSDYYTVTTLPATITYRPIRTTFH